MNWITSPAVIGFIGGAVSGPLVWYFANFLGEPIKRFWRVRGAVLLELNWHARYVPGLAAPNDAELFVFAIRWNEDEQANASRAFAELGHELVALWSNERTAACLLRYTRRIRGDLAGRLMLKLAQHMESKSPDDFVTRDEILRALKLSD